MISAVWYVQFIQPKELGINGGYSPEIVAFFSIGNKVPNTDKYAQWLYQIVSTVVPILIDAPKLSCPHSFQWVDIFCRHLPPLVRRRNHACLIPCPDQLSIKNHVLLAAASGPSAFIMEQQPLQPQQGDLNWRLSSHPITLLCFLGFRVGALLMYLFGVLFIKNLLVTVCLLQDQANYGLVSSCLS